ncbi:tetratricopeptide repeat protein [Mucilaginibacter sp. BJC16-A38]|uniref:tetratricopeptide repeat protein n=1 Tax=Mucilaginibacter phenanthrenivorans TaxID=1234842 RepID=UPI002158226C|nr:tetratricopeptide repeat protein [Mucilaginibacter phenanthrenivorans]MCR8556108.1 tetratricopeptide repeat protein [Mucilaginibacter phenanthrenivorans]
MTAGMAMTNLDRLNDIAAQLNDKSLQWAVFGLRADYYSVNRGFNSLGLNYYQEAIDFAKDNDMEIETAIALHQMGMYYYTYKNNAGAYPYLQDAYDKFSNIGFKEIPNIFSFINDFAVFYYNIGDYYNANLLLTEAIKYKAPNKRSEISAINSIGLIYRKYLQFPQALYYLNKSLNLAIASKDTAWIGIAGGNIGSVYLMQNNYQKALPFIRRDYNVSLKYNELENAAIALLRLAKINVQTGHIQMAAKQLDTVNNMINNITYGPSDILNQWIEYYGLKSIVYEHTGNLAAAVSYRKMLEVAKDSLAGKKNIAAFERMRLMYLIDSHRNLVNKLKSDEAVGFVKRNAIITMLFLLIIIFGLIYNRQLFKAKKEKEFLSIEKQRLDDELKNSIVELEIYTENLKQKNKLIEKFKQQLASIKENKANVYQLEELMPVNIMTDKSWDEFKVLFTKVHSGFFFNLKKHNPNISGADTRLLTLMRLNLNNREMANMLGITQEGIKKAKQRLRKKLELPDNETLEKFIAEI